MPNRAVRTIDVPAPFSLAATCGPVAWGGGRWPNVDWRDGAFVWVGWEGERIVWRSARQRVDGAFTVEGTASADGDRSWAARLLGIDEPCPTFADPTLATVRERMPGLRAYANGSVFDGLVTSIVGQSISVASAAVTESRLAQLFAEPTVLAGRSLWPLPRADQLADAPPALVRESGVTWRRAEAIVGAARAALEPAGLPDAASARADPGAARAALRSLPLVGPWTAESTLLWGIGLADAHPTGDIALLRAARRAYADPTLDLRRLDQLAETWRPARGWAARLLWTDLLGVAGRDVVPR